LRFHLSKGKIICSFGIYPQAKNTMKIHHIRALQVCDSRGNPTVEAEIILVNGLFASDCQDLPEVRNWKWNNFR